MSYYLAAREVALVLLAATLAGCAAGSVVDSSPVSSPASSPLSLVGDSADHDCQVVLREVERPRGDGGGYASVCDSAGRCWYRWDVVVDVSLVALESGAEPALLYRSGSNDFAQALPAAEVESDLPGYRRFRFEMAERTVRRGMSITSLMQARIELIPLVSLPTGRLFDHNAHDADWGNYQLDADNDWELVAGPRICPGPAPLPTATLEFTSDFREIQRGAIVPGGLLRVAYDQRRLTRCRAHYTFAPVWDLDATVVFLPGGEEVTAPVVEATLGPVGERVNPVLDIPLEVEVPEGATEVRLFFHNHHALGGLCSAYDSDYGANYRFAVDATSPNAVGWAGDFGTAIGRGDCSRRAGLADSMRIDSWMMTRATCVDVMVDVWVPGLTDEEAISPERLLPQVVYSVDEQPAEYGWLEFVERVGNNYRFRWTLPRDDMRYERWERYDYSFRFSTDGTSWYRVGRGGTQDGPPLTFTRDFTETFAGG